MLFEPVFCFSISKKQNQDVQFLPISRGVLLYFPRRWCGGSFLLYSRYTCYWGWCGKTLHTQQSSRSTHCLIDDLNLPKRCPKCPSFFITLLTSSIYRNAGIFLVKVVWLVAPCRIGWFFYYPRILWGVSFHTYGSYLKSCWTSLLFVLFVGILWCACCLLQCWNHLIHGMLRS